MIGSTIETRFEMRGGKPVLMRLAKADFVDDGKGKPVAINEFIGRHPIAAFGNSDGDLEMLEWTTSAGGARLGVIVHHTDAKREWKCDRASHVGKLDEALDEAARRGWTVVDMKRDWARVTRMSADEVLPRRWPVIAGEKVRRECGEANAPRRAGAVRTHRTSLGTEAARLRARYRHPAPPRPLWE